LDSWVTAHSLRSARCAKRDRTAPRYWRHPRLARLGFPLRDAAQKPRRPVWAGPAGRRLETAPERRRAPHLDALQQLQRARALPLTLEDL